jgi:peptidyl-prolyl cis-trans isomerase D
MLMQFIRERAQTWVAWMIVGLLVLVFAVWGINSYFEPESSVTVAKVGDTKISMPQFQAAYENQRAQLQAQLGGRIDPSLLESLGLKNQVLQRLVDQEVQVQATIAEGYRVGDVQVAQFINQIQAFQADGKFDKELYEQVLSRMMTSPAEWEQQQRRNLLLDQPLRGILASSFVTSRDVDHVLRLKNQQRDLGLTTLSLSRYTADVAVPDDELQAYFAQHRDNYMHPEQVRVDYLELSLSGLASQVTAPDEALTAAYEQEKQKFTSEERRRTSHILIEVAPDADQAVQDKARALAEEVLTKVRAGESFETLAETYSNDPGSAKQGGDLGYFGRGVMDKAFEDAAFSLAEGEVSGVVRSGFGFHIIKLTGIEAQHIKPFEEVRAQLETEYRHSEAEKRFYEMQEQLESLSFEHPDTLSFAADHLGLTVQTTDWLSRAAGEGVASNPKVRTAAFSSDVLNGGNNSELVELGPNDVLVLRIKEHKATAQKTLDEVRADVTDAIKQEKAKGRLRAEAEALLKRLADGEDPTTVAAAAATEWKRLGFVGRDDKTVDAAVMKAAFESARPAADKPLTQSLTLNNGDVVLFALYAVRDADSAQADAEARKVLQDSQAQAAGQAAFAGIVETWRQPVPITTYPEKL